MNDLENRTINLSHILESELELFKMAKVNSLDNRSYPIYALGNERYMLKKVGNDVYEVIDYWEIEDCRHEILEFKFYWEGFGGDYGNCICPTEQKDDECGSTIKISDDYIHYKNGIYELRDASKNINAEECRE